MDKSAASKGYGSKKPQNKNRAWIKVIKENMGRKVKIACDDGSKEIGKITAVSYDTPEVVVLETESHFSAYCIYIDHIASLQILDDKTCHNELPDPWTNSPKVEKTEKKEKPIPKIWGKKVLAEG